jgi:hypothetical protein
VNARVPLVDCLFSIDLCSVFNLLFIMIHAQFVRNAGFRWESDVLSETDNYFAENIILGKSFDHYHFYR